MNIIVDVGFCFEVPLHKYILLHDQRKEDNSYKLVQLAAATTASNSMFVNVCYIFLTVAISLKKGFRTIKKQRKTVVVAAACSWI